MLRGWYMKINSIKNICLITIIFTITGTFDPFLMGMDVIKERIKKSQQQFKDYCETYLNKVEDDELKIDRAWQMNQYIESLDLCCSEAKNFFDNKQAHDINEKTAVICDIDGTALADFVPTDKHYNTINYYPALPAMLKLYLYLTQREFVIFFISSRSDAFVNETIDNLKREAFIGCKKVICMPQDLRNQVNTAHNSTEIIAQWKEDIRRHLAEDEKYTIVATIDDQKTNLFDSSKKQRKYLGHPILLPQAPVSWIDIFK